MHRAGVVRTRNHSVIGSTEGAFVVIVITGDKSASVVAENETQKRSSGPVAIDGNNRNRDGGGAEGSGEEGRETDHANDKDSLRVQGTTIAGGLLV